MKIKNRLILSFISIILLFSLAISLTFEIWHKETLTNYIEEHYINTARKQADTVNSAIDDLISETETLASQKILIDALKEANKKYKNIDSGDILSEILAADHEWTKSEGHTTKADQILSSELSSYIKTYLSKDSNKYGEIFITDIQGATLGMTRVLTDYYQADEMWWEKTFNNGKGDIFLDDRGFDESVKTNVIGIAAPVRDGINIIGILKINYRIKQILYPATKIFSKAEEKDAYIIRTEGDTIISSEENIEKDYPVSKAIKGILNKNYLSGYLYDSHLGKEFIIGFTFINHHFFTRILNEKTKEEKWIPVSWIFLIEMHTEDAFYPIQKIRIILYPALASLCLISMLIAVYISRYIAISIDALEKEIKKRMEIESELKKAKELFENTFEYSAAGMVLAYVDGLICCANPAFCDMVGYPKEELEGKVNFKDITHKEDLTYNINLLTQLLDGTIHYIKIDKRYMHRSGDPVWASVVVSLLKDKDGKPLYLIAQVYDISEKKKIEEALKFNETRYRRLVEGSPGLIYILSNTRGRVYYSKRILGYSISHLTANPSLWRDSIHPDDIQAFDKAVDTAYQGEGYNIDYRIKNAEGTYRWFRDRSIGKDISENEILIEGLVSDITDLKNADIEIKQTKDKFENAFEHAAIGIALTKVDGTWFQVNKSFCDITGYSKNEMEGMKFQDITHPEDLNKDLELIKKILAGEIASFNIEKRYINKSGNYVWVYLTVSLLRDNNKNPLYFIAQVQDINDLKNAEASLVEKMTEIKINEEKYRTLFNNANDAIYLLCPNTGKIIDCNKKAADMDGYTIEELKSMDIKLLHSEEEQKLIPDTLGKVAKYGTVSGISGLHHIKKTGDIIPIEVNATMIKVGDKELNLSIVRDISVHVKTEESLRKLKEQAENAVEMKDKFVSFVVHDLRNPASTILAFLTLISNKGTKNLDEDQVKFLKLASSEAQKINLLVEDILNMSRLKSGLFRPRLRFVNPFNTAEKIISDFQYAAKKKGITLINAISMREPKPIFTDSILFTQVLENLVSNAIKFCKEGDKITIYLPESEVNMIAVEDTGSGIQPNSMSTLFDYTKKTSTLGTAGEKGTGFGLPLCNDIMKILGGSLTVTTVLGKGSTFYTKLPDIKPKILIVDDEYGFRVLQAEYLKKLGADIIEAENGEEAVKKIQEEHPNIVITDIYMPVMGGMELLSWIKGNKDTEHIIVITVTAMKNMKMRDEAFKIGADDFISKPIEPEELLPRVRRLLWQ